MTKEAIIEVIHKTIYQFFDVCGDNEEVPLSDKDKLLLSVNKAICNNIKTLEQEPETAHFILLDECVNSGYYCSKCRKKVVKEGWSDTVKKIKYCPNCGAEMEKEEWYRKNRR